MISCCCFTFRNSLSKGAKHFNAEFGKLGLLDYECGWSFLDFMLKIDDASTKKHKSILAPFLGKIVRHISIDMWRKNGALKRGGGEMPLVLEELQECVASGENPEERYEQKELACQVRNFVAGLSETERRVFVCRYWYLDSTAEIAKRFGFSENKVSSMLHRIRGKLEKYLIREGVR